MLKVAVIGVGSIGSQHARVYHELKDRCELVAVCDQDWDKAYDAADRYGIDGYTQYQYMLERVKPDAVSIAVPTLQHASIAIEAMSRGVHTLVEKPIAHTSNMAEMMLIAAEDHGTILMPGHIERFNPAVTKLFEVLPAIGRVVHIDACRRGPEWWGCPERPCAPDVGMLLELGVHELDIAHQIAGEVVGYAAQSVWRDKKDVATNALLRFEDDVMMTLRVGCTSPQKQRSLTVTGEKGVLYLDYQDQSLADHPDDFYRIERAEPLKLEIEHFLECVETGATPRVTAEDGVWAVTMAVRMLQ